MKLRIFGILFLLLLVGAYFGIKQYASGAVEEKISSTVDKVSQFADVEYEGVDVEPIGQEVTISNITVSPKKKLGVGRDEPIKIRELTIRDIDPNASEDKIPEYIDVKMEGVELGAKELGKKNAELLKSLGYGDEILVDLEVDYKYDYETKNLKVENFSLGSNDMGAIKTNFEISNIDLSKQVNPLGLMMSIMFGGGAIEYKDDSFLERSWKKESEEKNVTVEELKAEMIASIDKQMTGEDVTDFTKDAMNEMKKFIQNPKKISIQSNPKTPIGAGNFMMGENKPEDIIEMMGLKIKS